MENQCIFRGCKRQSEDFFYSPSDPILLQKWQKAANTKQKNFCVCIDHFRKCDIIVERNLEEFAIPIQNAMKQDIRVDRYCCGSCLKDLGDQVTSPTKELMKNFYDITEYHLVTEVLCFQCAQFLKIFSRFKNQIKQHHKELRLQSNPEVFVPAREKKRALQSEMSLPNKNVLRVCRHCPYKTYDKDAFFLHLCTEHGETQKSEFTIKIGSSESPVECFYCSKTFANDTSLQIHQAQSHPKKSIKKPAQPAQQKSSFVIRSPRSLSSGGSNLEQRRLQLLAKLENSVKRRIPLTEPPTVASPPPAITTRTSSQTIKKQNYNFEIFELGDELMNLKKEIEIKEEEPEEPAVEIRNIEDILRQENKTKRKQNIAKKQVETEILFKEEPEEEEEEELVVAEIIEEQSDATSENENESLNYIPPPKKSLTTAENFNKQVQCLDCKEYMSFEELADHRDAMHVQNDNQYYDDIRNSDLPPAPKKKYNKTKQIKSTAQVTCTLCSKVMQEWKLEKHKEQFHSDKAMQFLCHICCKSFPQITMFKYHMVSHDPDLQYRCDLCGKGFITKSKMLRHIKRVHMNIYQPRGVCTICNQKIYKSHRVKTHMEKYHPNGLDEGFRVNPETNYFDCHRCGASYADLYTFKRHDCGKGRFQLRCPDCGKPVKNEEFLQRHQETKCPILNKHSVLNKQLNVTSN